MCSSSLLPPAFISFTRTPHPTPLPAGRQRTKFRKPDVHVYLKQDVPGLGEQGEIVLSPLGLARNTLLPLGLAYYLPKWRGKPVLPEGWAPKVRAEELELEVITPAAMSAEVAARFLHPAAAVAGTRASRKGSASAATTTAETDTASASPDILERGMPAFVDVVRSLASAPLSFHRKANDSHTLYASLHPQDVVEELLAQYKVRLAVQDVQLPRIRELGAYPATLHLGEGEDPVPLRVVVLREEEEGEGAQQ